MDLVDETLNHVGVLRIKVEGFCEMLQGPVNHTLASVDLSDHYMDWRFLRHLVLQVKKHLQSIVVPVQGHEDIGFLELVERVLLVDLFCTLEPDQGFLWLRTVVANHAHVSVEYW